MGSEGVLYYTKATFYIFPFSFACNATQYALADDLIPLLFL